MAKKTKQIKNTIKQRKEERFNETKNTNLVRVFLINKLEMMLFFLFVVVFFALGFRYSQTRSSVPIANKLRESSFNMTRGGGGDEDIEGGAPKIFRHLKGGL